MIHSINRRTALRRLAITGAGAAGASAAPRIAGRSVATPPGSP